MNPFKTPFRRTGTVVAGAALGLIGVMSTAMPALACHPEFDQKATTACVDADGNWQIDWSVAPSDNQLGDGVIESLNYTILPASAPQNIEVSGTLQENAPFTFGTTLTATQKVDKAVESVKLNVTGRWGGYAKGGSLSVPKPTEKCDTPEPSASVSTPASPVPSASESTSAEPSPSASESTSAAPSPSASESTSPSAPVSPSTTTSLPPEDTTVTEPQFIYDATCDTLTVGIEVPVDWKESLTVTFKPTVGDSKTVTAAPGETKTVDFKASKGLKVTATPKGYEDEAATVTYKAPADCDDDELALTGANSSTIAGGAALALVLGAGLFYMARRRKIRFTA
ncbi:LPXTG cell wall anchor domain-containing protein [Actinoplanes palleronii]|uniref:LPXTG-motif cell wall-anchored protein n=1 Tax=Actinoplanes palleronii TaxID=113570 RepID=A0ABQ4BK89_9ACTN|nr:LPXTG cell wall anchor domain-containing protein [Actinoplanes palleronii]GIE71055.1 hypothetical protein Apa02nite_071630 [Actinoplanes palleronii]